MDLDKTKDKELIKKLKKYMEISKIEEEMEDLEPKIIQWITLEKEVMDEVNRRFVDGIITRGEWNRYFVNIVSQYGGSIMSTVLNDFMKIQKISIADLDENAIKKEIQKLLNLDRFIKGSAITTTATVAEDWSNTDGLFEDLHGKLYEPVVNEDDADVCPKCKEDNILIPLNSRYDDPDYLYYRCHKCSMDFKIKNKPSKDFELIK